MIKSISKIWIVSILFVTILYPAKIDIDSFYKAIRDANVTIVKEALKDKEIENSIQTNNDAINLATRYMDFFVKTEDDLDRREAIMLLLLKHGAEMYIETFNEGTILSEAIKENYYELVKYLLDKGDIHKFLEIGRTKDIIKFVSGKPMLDLLIKHNLGSIDYVDSNGNTILHILLGNLKVKNGLDCKNLGELSKFIGQENKQGYTPLDKFIMGVSTPKEKECFMDILKQRKKIEENPKKYRFLLYSMIDREFSLKDIEFAIKKGVTIDARNYDEETALFEAVYKNNFEVVKLLIDNSADINLTNSYGNSILMKAIKEDANISIDKLLINSGIDINIVNKSGESAYSLSKEKDLTELNKIFKAKKAKILSKKEIEDIKYKKAYLKALKYRDFQTIENLIDNNYVDINTTLADGSTPIEYLMNYKETWIINYLIEKGIDLNLGNETPTTLLAQALSKNMSIVADSLIQHGAKLDSEIVRDGFVYLEDESFILELLNKEPSLLKGVNTLGDTMLTDIKPPRGKSLEFVKKLLHYVDLKAENRDGTYNNLFRLIKHHGSKEYATPFVKAFLGYGYRDDIKLKNGETLLMKALKYKANLNIVKMFVNPKSLQEKSKNNLPIGGYLAYSTPEVVEYMLSQGVKIDVSGGRDDMTPLMIAIQENNKDTFQYFIDKKIINCENKYGRTALNIAQYHDYGYMIEALIKAGAKANTKEYIKKKTKEYNQERKRLKGLRKILADGDLNLLKEEYKKVKGYELDEFIYTLITYANVDEFKTIVDSGLSLKYKDSNGWDLLKNAVYFNNLEVLKYLIEKSPAFKKKIKTEKELVELSANSSIEIIKFLIKNGMDTQAEKEKFIKYALFYGKKDIIEFLIKSGYPFNLSDISDDNIMTYLKRGSTDSLAFLFSKGLDVNHKVYFGFHKEPLLIYAIRTAPFKMVKFLIDNGADVNSLIQYDSGSIFRQPPTSISVAIIMDDRNSFDLLLEKGVKIDAFDKENDIAPLLIALINEHAYYAQELIKKGAKIDVANDINSSALLFAVNNGFTKTVEMLTQKGADPHRKNNRDYDPIRIAQEKGYSFLSPYLGVEIKPLKKTKKPIIKDNFKKDINIEDIDKKYFIFALLSILVLIVIFINVRKKHKKK